MLNNLLFKGVKTFRLKLQRDENGEEKIHQHTLNSFFQICSSGPKYGLHTVWYSY